jgi:hypothetical protein
MLGSSWAAAQLAASQEGLSSMNEWVSEWIEKKKYFTPFVQNLFNIIYKLILILDVIKANSAEIIKGHSAA